MKILSNNMPSIHKIWKIAIEELFDINISEKVHNTEQCSKLSSVQN